jgi:hypothetical protein
MKISRTSPIWMVSWRISKRRWLKKGNNGSNHCAGIKEET